eukprot:TRINITY_DN28876_c0_g1_i1.p1 TRINITY_DN28876_c0_g1~~TRINITY_DN28876_c0_g1_i1.p1  ORF type:complete len:473 (-),score=98.82 TRINITY_DN28876_c0_g1_i1:59-1477(-)
MEGGAAPRPFTVLCTGFEDVEDYVVYVLNVTHEATGSTWIVKRRFSELNAAAERLEEALGKAARLPEFPDKGPPGMSFLMGRELVVKRVAALQRWLEGVSGREDAARSRELQLLLGVRAPGADNGAMPQVRGHTWRDVGGGATVELDIDVTSLAHCGPIDELTASVQVIAGRGIGFCLPRPPCCRARPGKPLRVTSLPSGEEVTIEVKARNAVGESAGALVHLLVPGKRSGPLLPGGRVRAVWAGDNRWYDGVVKAVCSDGNVLVTWLRPAPLSDEVLVCVCESGGDDTAHRNVPRALVKSIDESDSGDGDEEEACIDVDAKPPDSLPPAAGAARQDGASARMAPAPLRPPAPSPPISPPESPSPRRRESGARSPGSRSGPENRGSAAAEGTVALGDVVSEELLLFSLGVRLDERGVKRLEWHLGDDLPAAVDAFLDQHRLRLIFREPMLAQAELMVHMGKRRNEIDVIDLL